jgi:tryptophan-rich sensory protein
MWPSFAVFCGIVFSAALSGALFGPSQWYRDLKKPSWQPPDWLFGPAWTFLYILIAIAGWRVWSAAEPGAALVPMAVFGVQIVLNAAWSWLFFGLKRMTWALYECAALWVSIALMIAVFAPIDSLAAVLLAPYLAWVTFAGFLNWTMIRLNPDANAGAGEQRLAA